ncbi:MAG: malto-oligosyltrehalose trehalohydrolase [Planctomycetes bacterium]|nr:malto-oligosyltrehalose trehalohydrolase [Planctomycetota bacterium]MBI3844822.1 malto-oligosyltrehalose trehalohydrolase [Planctomycetota bacterium]
MNLHATRGARPLAAGWRRLAIGAEEAPDGAVHFRVWAPRVQGTVEVVVEGGPVVKLSAEEHGYFSGHLTGTARRESCLYRYRLDGETLAPDPASRFQPDGPHGPSQVIAPDRFQWSDDSWRGMKVEGQIIYEMHIGTFTKEGTWAAASRELDKLSSLGITVIEVMPVHDFPGKFGWGYDGVDLFAPTRLYGSPDDFRRFVDRAHALRLGVILDVVYNHFGPEGNYLERFSESYFANHDETDWGRAINFECEPVREFFVSNAGYWIDEFHLDGLRLDATQAIRDESPDHVLAAITRRVRDAAKGRSAIVLAENEPQDERLVRSTEQGGYGIDALWSDDFHHSAMVALTGRAEAYYSDYRGVPQEFISALKHGFLFQGQHSSWQEQRRGTPVIGRPRSTFVFFVQNHDQVSNSARGQRCHQLANAGRHRAMTALLLLAPQTPLLFQGQEFSASSPFLYFSNLEPRIAKLVREGREKFLTQFPSLACPETRAALPDPSDPRTFERSKLDHSERETHAEASALHRDLIRLRREDPVFGSQRANGLDGAVLDAHAFVIRFFGDAGDDRLLLVNFGRDLRLEPAPEPLLAPVKDEEWSVSWSSEDPRYGGHGTPPPERDGHWHIPGEAALVLAPTHQKARA